MATIENKQVNLVREVDIFDKYELLGNINSPVDVRQLSESQLPQLASEVRDYLVEVTSKTGGHLAAGLGTVELTVALHFLYNTPHDRIVWDIGHQAYPHKILTGRKERMDTIRKSGGLSGFLKRDESEYDTFGAGHSSTSISAGLGMAVALAAQGENRSVISVIGDGAMTAGLAYEALNNAGASNVDLLVVLNDNEMSISPNVGAVSNYLARMMSGKAYMSIREGSKAVLGVMPPSFQEFSNRIESHAKGLILPSSLFEELGFYYIGPIDGHDIPTLLQTLRNLGRIKGPRFLHIVTKKGKGYDPAEEDPLAYHGVSPFDTKTGKMKKKASSGVSYTQVFGKWLCDMAAMDSKLFGITPAMREGSGLVEFQARFPDRYFDVGIAEQHAVTFAAGIACEKMKPVVAIYSTFLQRGYDQLIHDVCIQNLDVTFALDRSGYIGGDGPTHAGLYDYAYLRCIPNMVVMAPADEAETRDMLYTAYQYEGPASVRYPRGTGVGAEQREQMQAYPIGVAELTRERTENNQPGVAILAFGSMLSTATAAAQELDATVVNMRFVKPIDEDMVLEMARTHAWLVTIEEHVVAGGAGSAVNEVLAKHGLPANILNIGMPDCNVEHGVPADVFAEHGLDADSVIKKVQALDIAKGAGQENY